jgi:peptidoglycan hydrolase-like protein with peptidoglycan-binding domain
MTGLRRIGLIAILGMFLVSIQGWLPGVGPELGFVAPASAKNRVGSFFNKVGDAIANNPLTKRNKRNETQNRSQNQPPAGEPAFGKQTRIRIQTRLNELGHKVGPADGVFGRGTRRGIAGYQSSLGADATGILTRAQADLILSGAPAGEYRETAGSEPVNHESPGTIVETVKEIATPDAVWTSLAMRSCKQEDMLSCMDRFGAPSAAVAFVRQSGEAGIKPGLLAGFDDFGIVDIGRIQFRGTGRQTMPVLLNGGPPAILVDTEQVRSLQLTDNVYRRLVGRYGELKLFDRPRLESHRLTARGGQRFVFAFRLAKCDTCAAPGEALLAYDFDAAGGYLGVALLGIARRDPDQDWLTANNVAAVALQNDMGVLQRRLAGLGFDSGTLDGKGGKQTEAALKAFQADHGLTQSGKPDDQTNRLLAKTNILIEFNRFEQIYRLAEEPDVLKFVLQNGLSVLSRAEKQLNATGVMLAGMNSRIARLHDRQKDHEKALSFAKKAVAVSAAAGQDASQSHGFYLFDLGENYRHFKRDDEALESYNAAFDVFEPLALSGNSRTSRELAAKAFERTGKRLIALYEKRNKAWAAKKVQKRLEKVEAKLAAIE